MTKITGPELLAAFTKERSKYATDAACHRALAVRYDLNADSVRGRLYRERKKPRREADAKGAAWRAAHKTITPNPELFRHDLGTPWVLPDAGYIVIGDVQLVTTRYDFAALPMAIGKQELPRGKRYCILAGDFVNADAFSGYESDQDETAFAAEVEAGRAFFDEYLTVFDRIFWLYGNHERRLGKRTKGAIKPLHLLRTMTWDKRVEVSHWGHCVVENERGHDWRISHARNYSINQLTVADQLALKYQQNIIQHHEHHCAKGWDRYGRYIVIDNGGLFDYEQMAYAVIDDSKSAIMKNGFTLLRRGVSHLFSDDPFTDWEMWLPERRLRVVKRAA